MAFAIRAPRLKWRLTGLRGTKMPAEIELELPVGESSCKRALLISILSESLPSSAAAAAAQISVGLQSWEV